ncbi:MAG TPA: glycosyltransferase family 39 protein [Chloroflexia bacterium]|nr:glycosyltransferase family 39 protein [Chloroflexia bacterium]
MQAFRKKSFEKFVVTAPLTSLRQTKLFQVVIVLFPVTALIAAAFFIRYYHFTRLSIWMDESYDLRLARDLSFWQTFTYSFSAVPHAPLFTTLMHIWQNMLGVSELKVRLFALITAMLTLPLVYYIAQRWINLPVAILSLLLMTVSPLDVYWSQSIRPYGLLTLLITTSMILALFVTEYSNNNWCWLFYNLNLIVLVYLHYLSFHIIFGQVVFFLITFIPTRNKRALISLGAVLLVTGIAFLPWLGNFLAQSGNGPNVYQPGSLDQIGQVFEALASWFTNPVLLFMIGAVFGPLYLLGIYWLWQHHRKIAVLLLCWSFLPVITTWVSSLIRPNFLIRYFVICLPAFLIIVAAGIWSTATLVRKSWLKPALPAVAVGLVLWLNLSSLVHYERYYTQQNWRELVNYIVDNRWQEDVIFFANPWGYLQTPFDFYYQDVLGL